MAELRHDALTDRVVIVAADRAARPHTVRHPEAPIPTAVADCPFCVGNETLTPPELTRFGPGAADQPGWTVRVVPNKYPILDGSHEVAILAPSHDAPFSELAVDHASALVRLLRDRCAVHLDQGAAFAHAFINHGRAAGASIEHPHAQVTALDFVPPAVEAEAARFASSARDLLALSLDEARRHATVIADDEVAVWCPWASVSSFETLVVHRAAGASFATEADDVLTAIAASLRSILRAIHTTLGDAAYNVVVHTGPRGTPPPQRWYLRITPRLGALAGFEFGSGVYVNPLPPEHAATALREALETFLP